MKEVLCPHALVLILSEQVSQYRCMNLPKTDDNDRTQKLCKYPVPYPDIYSMLLSGQMPHRSTSSHLFWNLD